MLEPSGILLRLCKALPVWLRLGREMSSLFTCESGLCCDKHRHLLCQKFSWWLRFEFSCRTCCWKADDKSV